MAWPASAGRVSLSSDGGLMAVRKLGQPDERDEGGYVALLVVVLVVTVIAVVLLTRTLSHARMINAKAENIAETGRGINASTDAIMQLNFTNQYGDNIEATAAPLVPRLNTIIDIAKSINGKATTITESAVTINGTAKTIGRSGGSINNSARGIEGNTSAIIPIANSIQGGVVTINQNVMDTIGIAEAVRSDVGNILGEARTAVRRSACIDRKTALGSHGNPGCP